jgi:type III secretion system YopN/LcrE/InvE/MxiC family regulator
MADNLSVRHSNTQQVSGAGDSYDVDAPDKPKGAVAVSDPAEILAELAEELGFIEAEEWGTVEAKEDEEADFSDFLQDLIEQAEQIQDPSAAEEIEDQSEEALAQLRTLFREKDFLERRHIDDALREATGGSSHRGLLVLKNIVDKAEKDPSIKALGISRETLLQYAETHADGLTAAVNIADILDKAPNEASESAAHILDLYEQSVVSSQGVLQTFQRLGRSEGIGKISEWKTFLTEAVAADLSSQHSSQDKNKLQLVLQELKGFRLFNTLTSGLEKLDRYIAPPSEKKLSDEESSKVLQTTLDYIEQPIKEFLTVQSWVSGKDTQNQILFFQGYRNLLKSIPEDAYVNGEQKANSLVSLQKKIDDLTYSEEEFD